MFSSCVVWGSSLADKCLLKFSLIWIIPHKADSPGNRNMCGIHSWKGKCNSELLTFQILNWNEENEPTCKSKSFLLSANLQALAAPGDNALSPCTLFEVLVSVEDKQENYSKDEKPLKLICCLNKSGANLLIAYELFRAVFLGLSVVKNKVFFVV